MRDSGLPPAGDDRGPHTRREGGPLAAGSPHVRISGWVTAIRGSEKSRHVQENHKRRPALPSPRVLLGQGPRVQVTQEESHGQNRSEGGPEASLDH